MTVSTRVISYTNRFLEIEDSWNKLVHKCSEKNPFVFSGFVNQFIEFNRSRGWNPLIFITSTDDAIVGVVPLVTKKKFGVCFAKLLSGSGTGLFSDFIVDDQYRETCISHALSFLFRKARCRFIELTLPAASPNISILKQQCKAKGIWFSTKPTMGHCVIPIRSTWDEFKMLRGSNFRRKFKRLRRNLDRAGSWRIVCIKNGNKESDAINRILDVEKKSWKEEWRTRDKGPVSVDEDLLMIWKGAQYTAETEQDFKWSVWFLELNDQTLAYTLVLQYKKVAFIMKTSYDERYKKLYPGIYVNNEAVQELFNERQVNYIDWLTDLPFHRNWTSTCLPRVRVVMSEKGVSSTVYQLSAFAYNTLKHPWLDCAYGLLPFGD